MLLPLACLVGIDEVDASVCFEKASISLHFAHHEEHPTWILSQKYISPLSTSLPLSSPTPTPQSFLQHLTHLGEWAHHTVGRRSEREGRKEYHPVIPKIRKESLHLPPLPHCTTSPHHVCQRPFGCMCHESTTPLSSLQRVYTYLKPLFLSSSPCYKHTRRAILPSSSSTFRPQGIRPAWCVTIPGIVNYSYMYNFVVTVTFIVNSQTPPLLSLHHCLTSGVAWHLTFLLPTTSLL